MLINLAISLSFSSGKIFSLWKNSHKQTCLLKFAPFSSIDILIIDKLTNQTTICSHFSWYWRCDNWNNVNQWMLLYCTHKPSVFLMLGHKFEYITTYWLNCWQVKVHLLKEVQFSNYSVIGELTERCALFRSLTWWQQVSDHVVLCHVTWVQLQSF